MNDSDRKPFVFLGQPGYGELTAGAARAFWRATKLPDDRVYRQYNEGSLLAQNFNALWCGALNLQRSGQRVDYFAMIHADVEPQDWWLDVLIDELESSKLDILGAVVPIKDPQGLTSLALDRPDGDTWRPLCRLTLAEVYRLPATFTSVDVGHPLLLNTGLWVCRFGDWARQVRFTINDRIVQTPDGRYVPQVEPEDWYFSRLGHELGLRIGATRKVKLNHRGGAAYGNDRPWGDPHDSAYVDASPIPADGFVWPHDVPGWLTYDEGKALYDLARGKRVFEIGSYCGLSTICLSQSATLVVSLDPHDGRGTASPQATRAQLDANLERWGVADKVEAITGTATPDTIPSFDCGKYDLVFIDGAHDAESVRNDIACARKLLAPDGLIAFHDYGSPVDPDVAIAVDELIAEGGELLSLSGSLATVRPPAGIPLEV